MILPNATRAFRASLLAPERHTNTARALRHQVLPVASELAVVLCDVPFLGVAPLLPAAVVPRL
ncbi:MAG: hypothetical protein ABSA53_17970, partial [Streptosporangiaceae bacterium]